MRCLAARNDITYICPNLLRLLQGLVVKHTGILGPPMQHDDCALLLRCAGSASTRSGGVGTVGIEANYHRYLISGETSEKEKRTNTGHLHKHKKEERVSRQLFVFGRVEFPLIYCLFSIGGGTSFFAQCPCLLTLSSCTEAAAARRSSVPDDSFDKLTDGV